MFEFVSTTQGIFGTLAAFVASAFAAGGGIGGGGLLVPLFILVQDLAPHTAIPLSKATIFGAAIANFILNVSQKHPTRNHRPLIDYDVALVMEPMTLAGTVIGVYLNKAFPNWLITLLLVALLSYTTLRTYRKGMSTYKKESNVSYSNASSGSFEMVDVEESQSLVNGETSDIYEKKQQIALIIAEESRTPWDKIFLLFFIWIILFVFLLLKGGHGAPSVVGLVCGSLGYWLVVCTVLPFLVLITYWIGKKIVRTHSKMESIGYEYAEGDIAWDSEKIIKYPLYCTMAGVFAGMLGIGGGMIKGPLMLEMGMIPQVSAATAAFMILFTSSATTAQFLILGMLELDLALWYAVVGFASSFVGQKVVGYLLEKYKKTSLIIFVIALSIGGSTILMTITGVKDIIEEGFGSFHGICGASNVKVIHPSHEDAVNALKSQRLF